MASTTPWLDLMRSLVGEREVKGPKHNPKLVEVIEQASHFKDDDHAWCATFTNGIIKLSGYAPSANPAMARGFLSWGIKLDSPVPGAIMVTERGRAPFGHVDVVETVNANGTVTVLGANVGDMVKRYTRSATAGLLGYRWPSDAPLPDGVRSTQARPAPRYQLGERDLKVGVRGQDVEAWQELLNEFGYGLNVDGIYGLGTRDATMSRQKYAGLRQDGVAGKATITKTIADAEARRAKAAKRKAEGKGAAIGGGAVIGTGAVVAVDQGLSTLDRVKDLLSPGVGEIVVLLAIVALVGFGIWYFFIKPQRSEPTRKEQVEVWTAEAMYDEDDAEDETPFEIPGFIPRREVVG